MRCKVVNASWKLNAMANPEMRKAKERNEGQRKVVTKAAREEVRRVKRKSKEEDEKRAEEAKEKGVIGKRRRLVGARRG